MLAFRSPGRPLHRVWSAVTPPADAATTKISCMLACCMVSNLFAQGRASVQVPVQSEHRANRLVPLPHRKPHRREPWRCFGGCYLTIACKHSGRRGSGFARPMHLPRSDVLSAFTDGGAVSTPKPQQVNRSTAGRRAGRFVTEVRTQPTHYTDLPELRRFHAGNG